MEFEYDRAKSESNKAKHGVDFEQAKALWDDPRALSVPLLYVDEPRYVVIGMMGGKHWSAICTDRGTKVRIISCRRSHKKEEEAYEDDCC